ncbi:hypothetical protein ACLB2K_013742 [Fragaria x ananassa]
MFGHDAVLPLEVHVALLRFASRNKTNCLVTITSRRCGKSLKISTNNLILEKQRVTTFYDKVTRVRSFTEGQAVWRVVLPLGEKTEGRGKWSVRWEGPFIIHRIMPKGAYHLRDLAGTLHPNPTNGCFLKRYIVGVWELADPPHPPDAATIVHSAPRLRDSTPPPPTRGNLREKHANAEVVQANAGGVQVQAA